MKKIAVNGVPPGAKISVGTDGPDAPGAGDSESKPASGPTAKSGTAKDPNQRRGGHPTELGAGQGRSLLGPDTGQTKDVADKLGDTGRHVFSIEDDKPRGGFGPSGSIDSGDRKTSAPDKGPKGGGSGDDGHERLKEQINNIRERQEKQQKQQEEKERQDRLAKMEALKAERKAARGTFGRNIYEQKRGKAPAKSPGPSGSTDSGDRRPNLLDPTSKPPSSGLLNMDALKDIKPARQSLLTPASTQHARALAAMERARGYMPEPEEPENAGDSEFVTDWSRPVEPPDPSRALNKDALQAIKAFDKKVAPRAEKEEAWSREVVDAWSGLKEMATGKYKGATSAVAVTKAQKAANARMVEALAKTPDNKALAGLFADAIMSGSPLAGAVYGDFLQQLGKEDKDRAETFDEAVGEAWAEKAGWDGEMSDFMRALIYTSGFGGLLPKLHADSSAYKREMIARYINQSRRNGVNDPEMDKLERMLDTDHKKAVEQWETMFWGPPPAGR